MMKMLIFFQTRASTVSHKSQHVLSFSLPPLCELQGLCDLTAVRCGPGLSADRMHLHAKYIFSAWQHHYFHPKMKSATQNIFTCVGP